LKMEQKIRDKICNACNMLILNRGTRFCYSAMRRTLQLKPVIDTLTVQLADHCNLNCSGCSHFSPLADKLFANITQYDCDMKQLSHLVTGINRILLLGGEPLLHPEVTIFIDSTRTWFPTVKINLITNGVLLPKMPRKFWETCKRNLVSVNLTLYPPLFNKESDFMKLAKTEGITLNITKISTFRATINSKGNTELEENYNRCRKWRYFPILKEGKIYPCAKPAYIHYFNKAFGTKIPNTGFVDLYDPKMTGWKLLSRLQKSSETCRYCTYGWEKIPTQEWSISCRNQNEWDVA
jgi:organic radical activating enzyme